MQQHNRKQINGSTVSTTPEGTKEHRCKGKGGFEATLKELQESGVLTEDDVNKIDAYHKEKREAKMKEKMHESIDEMVKDKVITTEKGQKLKEALDKKIEKQVFFEWELCWGAGV